MDLGISTVGSLQLLQQGMSNPVGIMTWMTGRGSFLKSSSTWWCVGGVSLKTLCNSSDIGWNYVSPVAFTMPPKCIWFGALQGTSHFTKHYKAKGAVWTAWVLIICRNAPIIAAAQQWAQDQAFWGGRGGSRWKKRDENTWEMQGDPSVMTNTWWPR